MEMQVRVGPEPAAEAGALAFAVATQQGEVVLVTEPGEQRPRPVADPRW